MNGSNNTYEDPAHYGQASNMAQTLGMQWNPKHLEIKTRSVEKTLEPLVMQVCSCGHKLVTPIIP